MKLTKYPRQFLVSTLPAQGLDTLKKVFLQNFYIYHCESLNITISTDVSSDKFAVLFGYLYDSTFSQEEEIDVLDKLLELN